MIGRIGQLVVSVTIVSISPTGILEVSIWTLNFTLCPGLHHGMSLCDHEHASASTL